MVPLSDIAERPAVLFAADTVTLNQGDGNVIDLVKAPFTPGPLITLADLVVATFPGYAAKNSTTPPVEGIDPLTGDFVIEIPPPAGGWRWETTGAVSPAQTIYGYMLTNQDSGDLFACQLFPVPIVLALINQVVQIGAVTFRIRNGSMS